MNPTVMWVLILLATLLVVGVFGKWLFGIRYIPTNRVGIIERWWSFKGSLKEGRIIAINGEAGIQARILRGGLHLFYFPWVYRIHRQNLVTIAEGKIGYLYARLQSSQ